MNNYSLAIEPDGNGLHKVSSKNLKKSFQLYSFDMIPQYLQSNPYIQTGYRHDLTVKGCLIRYSIISIIKSLRKKIFSLFYLNNESVNIWSHLIGAGLFMYFLIRDIYNGKALQILASLTDCSFALFYILSVIVSVIMKKSFLVSFSSTYRHVCYVQLSFICLIVPHREHLIIFLNWIYLGLY
jgi:predicted membrane channel-forming protein YqfA (hemolysin III family)